MQLSDGEVVWPTAVGPDAIRNRLCDVTAFRAPRHNSRPKLPLLNADSAAVEFSHSRRRDTKLISCNPS